MAHLDGASLRSILHSGLGLLIVSVGGCGPGSSELPRTQPTPRTNPPTVSQQLVGEAPDFEPLELWTRAPRSPVSEPVIAPEDFASFELWAGTRRSLAPEPVADVDDLEPLELWTRAPERPPVAVALVAAALPITPAAPALSETDVQKINEDLKEQDRLLRASELPLSDRRAELLTLARESLAEKKGIRVDRLDARDRAETRHWVHQILSP